MNQLAAFLSNHFEVIMSIQVFYMIGMVVIVLFLQVRDLRLIHLQKAFKEVLYYLIVIGQTALLVSLVYVFSLNLAPKPPIDFSYRILSTTKWVKDDLTIYFITDNKLVSTRPDGSDRKTVFKANDKIRAYQFSPDGKNILIVTESQLYLYHPKIKTRELIDGLNFSLESNPEGIKGSVGRVRFNPQGDKFCYHLAKWSQYGSQDNWFVYDIVKKQKSPIVSPGLALGSLIWDEKGENLYYPWFEALNSSIEANPYRVKLYKVPLKTLKPELAMQFNFDKPELSPEHLAMHSVDLDFSVDRFSFGRDSKVEAISRSKQGAVIGVDETDILYIRNHWWKRRLYQIPRVPMQSDMERYQYKGGQLAVQHLQWFPSGRYVIMEHYFFGILILDPQTGKLGILDNQRGNTFGWYARNN